VAQDVDADGGGETFVACPGVVDFGGKCVEGGGFLDGDDAEGLPELRLQRHAGAVTVES
jgi:hypothetical protein